MKFVVISVTICLVSGSYFDWPLNRAFRPVYRRFKEDNFRRIFQSKSLNFDLGYQKVNRYFDQNPSLYYDSAWSDWRQNPLQNNIQSNILLPWRQISVSTSLNPISGDEKDIFAATFPDREIKRI